MILSDEIKRLENYSGKNNMPADFREYWEKMLCNTPDIEQLEREQLGFENREAIYEYLTCPAFDGGNLHLRVIRPAAEGKYPTILMFHDIDCRIRGWHHMTRFAGLGFAVVALENRISDCKKENRWSAKSLKMCIVDALWTERLTEKFSWADQSRMHTWGEGFGGALAMAAAAWLPQECKCAVRSPLPIDLQYETTEERESAAYVDILNFAELMHGGFLLGTGMMEESSSVRGQFAAFSRVPCAKRHLKYPKYGHERINHFENEVLNFFALS
ncbi:MAG: acetylxylan esterase [Lachnospiraceae bacterium]|nr:acetylxylan esterase [Lachnospiraceae bacterium]